MRYIDFRRKMDKFAVFSLNDARMLSADLFRTGK
jgi:hypothetical protein